MAYPGPSSQPVTMSAHGMPPADSLIASPQVEAFLTSHRLQPHAAMQMRMLPEALQMIVLNQGPMHCARDPTAVLVARIAKVRQGVAPTISPESTGQIFAEARPGDWACPNCRGHVFAEHTHCRKCGTPHPQEGQLVPGAEHFLSQACIQPHVLHQFRSLQPAQQRSVMDRGNLAGSRDPNAVLMGRIRSVHSGAASDAASARGARGMEPGMRFGDWACPTCGDVQFAHNKACRQCGTANPKLPPGW